MKRNITWVNLIGLAICIGLFQSCLHNPDSKGLEAIAPGLYKGTQKDGMAVYLFKYDSTGALDFRQCDPDSTVIGQSESNLTFKNDSAFFSGRRSRTWRYFDNSRTSGEWTEWMERENTGGKRDSAFSEILSERVTAKLGDEWVVFNRLGPASSKWPTTKNDLSE